MKITTKLFLIICNDLQDMFRYVLSPVMSPDSLRFWKIISDKISASHRLFKRSHVIKVVPMDRNMEIVKCDALTRRSCGRADSVMDSQTTGPGSRPGWYGTFYRASDWLPLHYYS